MTDDDFDEWRDALVVRLEKLFENDREVDGYGNVKVKKES